MNRRRIKQWRRRSLMHRLVIIPIGFVFTITLVIITLSDSSDSVEIASVGLQAPKDEKLRFILVGDTGGLPGLPGIPVLRETKVQKNVARRLAEISKSPGLEAIITMGDNIYFTGVKDEFDERFESSFENPYKSPLFENKRFYMIAGNHDHFGNISAQVAYTKYSKKWFYPSLYYNFTLSAQDGVAADFLMIDTIVLCGNTKDIEFAGFFKMLTSKSKEPNGAANITAAEIQWKWIEEQLAASRAPYLFVVGHYPIHSISSHGPIKCMGERLTPLLEKYNATAYIAGHDHTLQHITYPTGNGRTMHFIVSGAGSRSDPSTKHMDTVASPGQVKYHFPTSGTIINQMGMSGDGGFISAELTAKECFLKFLSSKGEQLYKASLEPR